MEPIKITFSDEVIDELIKLTRERKITWAGHEVGQNYYSSIGEVSLYFYEGYVDSNTQSKDLKLHIGDKHMEQTLYHCDEEKSCKLSQLGETIREVSIGTKETSEKAINKAILKQLRKVWTK